MKYSREQIEAVQATARRYMAIVLNDEQAVKVLEWDDEPDQRTFIAELSADGNLDTYPRDYFRMAVVDLVIPGKPNIVDSFMGDPCRWHIPCNASDDEYTKAFYEAFAAGLKDKGIPLAD